MVQNISSMKLVLPLLISSLIILNMVSLPSNALNIGVQSNYQYQPTHFLLKPKIQRCSRTCESDFCLVPPFMKYGKYCGLLYNGCPGEEACDGLDTCCMNHDACVKDKNYDFLSQECTQNFLKCMDDVKNSKADTFKGNTCNTTEVIGVISNVMNIKLKAGKALNRP